MSHMTITIDGQTVMNDNPGQWTHKPPNLNKLGLGRPHRPQPEPWRMLIGFLLAEASAQQATRTQPQPGTWTMTKTTDHAGNTTINVTTQQQP